MLISIPLPAQSHGEVFNCLQLPLVTRLYWNEAMKIAVTHMPNNGGWKKKTTTTSNAKKNERV